MTVAVAEEDAVRIEDLHAELRLELAQRAEHPIDRASRRLGLMIDGDDEEAALDHVA